AAPPGKHIVASHRKSGTDEICRHRRSHDAETDDANPVGYGHLSLLPALHSPSALTAANSASIDSRGILRTMKTMRERRSVSGPCSSVTGGWNRCCAP